MKASHCRRCPASGTNIRRGVSITGRKYPMCPACRLAAERSRLLAGWKSRGLD